MKEYLWSFDDMGTHVEEHREEYVWIQCPQCCEGSDDWYHPLVCLYHRLKLKEKIHLSYVKYFSSNKLRFRRDELTDEFMEKTNDMICVPDSIK